MGCNEARGATKSRQVSVCLLWSRRCPFLRRGQTKRWWSFLTRHFAKVIRRSLHLSALLHLTIMCTKYGGFDVCHRMGPYTIFMLLRKFSRVMNNQNQQIWREECVTLRNVIQRPGHNLKESLARQQFNLLSSRVGDPCRFGYEHEGIRAHGRVVSGANQCPLSYRSIIRGLSMRVLLLQFLMFRCDVSSNITL